MDLQAKHCGFHAQGIGIADQAVLCRRIGRAHRRANFTRHAGDENKPSRFAGGHARQNFLRQCDGGQKVNIHNLLINRELRFNREAALGDAGIVDQAIHAIAPAPSLFNQRRKSSIIGCFKRQDKAAIWSAGRGNPFQCVQVTARQNEKCPLLCQLARKGGSDAG